MLNKILKHYLQFSPYTNPGCYKDSLYKSLPDDIGRIGFLIRNQIIHRIELGMSITGDVTPLKSFRKVKIPWYRQPEDDNFPTAAAMLVELYRRDSKGLTLTRKDDNKLVLTCRFVAILMACALKIKGIPTRVRSGFAPYFGIYGDKSIDHWINQYWSKEEKRWFTIDVDGSLFDGLSFNPYDLPKGVFDFSPDAWAWIREGKVDPDHFRNSGGYEGLVVIAWELFYDFHCLMNNEIIYAHHPSCVTLKNFPLLKEEELIEIDKLAHLMQEPDNNFDKLMEIWETSKKFRLLAGGLL
ncbi:hypothetical protein A2960_05245 [Candidatus Gottesmanbacteria bacterium RIFCSPLOWO2_01_FULL_39_12b]|uniref:Transglutaminase-like domain-containing protein n=1 Tax=Candidatus Gottesmanbacteria bacterium RIFCSPLOWO2_01_FULL_39_12b TaxID=1798388 RepID=A0A1F6ALZ5_9BACT|nr:MAG: hypothetical protein A2960_05245 [Candidatus Gottesmanbacteria bacterium RIFCSPLOWO2_01_FULL_39_12b]